MSEPIPRVADSRELGQGKKALDLFLGWIAVLPLLLLAAMAWAPGPWTLATAARWGAVVWSGALLAFYAGVRRGLTFSERSGGRWSELATMLLVFFCGVASLLLVSPLLAAAGLIVTGALDAWAGRVREAPTYFTALRPPQLALAALCVLLVALKS